MSCFFYKIAGNVGYIGQNQKTKFKIYLFIYFFLFFIFFILFYFIYLLIYLFFEFSLVSLISQYFSSFSISSFTIIPKPFLKKRFALSLLKLYLVDKFLSLRKLYFLSCLYAEIFSISRVLYYKQLLRQDD